VFKSIAGKETKKIWDNTFSKKLPRNIQSITLRKMRYIDAADVIDDLRSPPGNHLEALKGDRKGQHSIRINKQWRICFLWKNGHAHDVEICDYH
jgi:proteic killer suppression protein